MTLDDLQHPDCRACEERKRLSVSQLAEIAALKRKLAGGDPAELERALNGAIEDLEEEARMHYLRGDRIGERYSGEGRRSEVEAAHRIAKRLQDRADELRKVIPNAKETT